MMMMKMIILMMMVMMTMLEIQITTMYDLYSSLFSLFVCLTTTMMIFMLKE